MILQTRTSILTALMSLDGGADNAHFQDILDDIIIAREQARQLGLADYISNDRTQLRHQAKGIN